MSARRLQKQTGPDDREVVQDAFVSAIRKIDTFRGESAFGSRFYRIVANAALQKARRRQGRRIHVALEDVLRNSTAMDVMPRLSSTGPPPSTIRPAISKYGSR